MTRRELNRAAKAYARVCKYLGVSLKGECEKTPIRAVKALAEMTENVGRVEKDFFDFEFTTFDSTGDQLVTIGPIRYSSLCEHHHLPFFGEFYIGYVPSKKIAGLSKFARLVRFYSKAPNTQERLTARVADKLSELLKPEGLCVICSGLHTCICSRGANQHAKTVTSAIRGNCGVQIKSEVVALIYKDR